MRWTVDDGVLVMGSPEGARRGSLKQWLLDLAEKWSGDTILPMGRDEYEIIGVSPNRIHLVHRNSWEHLPDRDEILTR